MTIRLPGQTVSVRALLVVVYAQKVIVALQHEVRQTGCDHRRGVCAAKTG
jgi:hypothetical protein